MASGLSSRTPAHAPRHSTGPEALGDVAAHVDRVLLGRREGDVGLLARRAQDLMREQGITFNLDQQTGASEHILPFDLNPLMIPAEEWQEIEAGLAQRVRTWEAFLRDMYGPQEALKAGIVPFEFIYGDPRFQRECSGLRPLRDIYLHTAAVDLFRDPHGRWMVFEEHLANPTGAAYAVQNRRVLSQVCPELVSGQPIQPIHNYPTDLLETLLSVTPTGRSTARVVLLSAGVEDEAYYDHSALARQMGIPLVQGGDLIVLDHHVYLKTIAGLERVEVIYRRMETGWIDPVCFRGGSRRGVPGLVSCVRKGTVSVANGLGSDIADNRSLAPYVPAMMEFYLGESPLLPAIPTLHCRDVDVREQVFENWDRYVVKDALNRGPQSVAVGRELDERGRAHWRHRINAAPSAFVAQPWLAFQTVPTWTEQGWQPRHVGVRAFVLQNGSVRVTPCVLTRVALRDGSTRLSSGTGGGSKDTWIVGGGRHESASRASARGQAPRRMALGSRTADSLFWIGRYCERAEATTRLLRVVQQLRLETGGDDAAQDWQPIWETLATATGHSNRFFKRAAFRRPENLALYVMLDPDNHASVLACLRACRLNAAQIREALPPEVWTVLNSLALDLGSASERRAEPGVLEQVQSMALAEDVLRQCDELAGAVEKHMLHNDAWHFWQMGRHLERAMFVALTQRQVFLPRGGARAPDDVALDSLLRMVAGQYAYRSSYRTRPAPTPVAHLLLQDPDFPRSVAFCLERVADSLRNLFGERVRGDTPLHYCSHLRSELLFADIASYFPEDAGARVKPRAFCDWLQSVIERLERLSVTVADHYLSHQAAAPALAAGEED